jgi:serine/threonine protein phosphatase 1
MKAVIGDIHGCIRTFEILISRICKKYGIDSIYFIGDLVDRGSSSKQTLDLVISLKKYLNCYCLLGNHEDLMIDYIYKQNRYDGDMWFINGGLETIRSFVDNNYRKLTINKFIRREEIIKYFIPYGQFFDLLNEYLIVKAGKRKFLLSHGGIYNFNLPPDRQYENMNVDNIKIKYPFIWSRNTDFSNKKYYDYIIIHGHTPIKSLGLTNDIEKPFINKKDEDIISINIDTSCVYGNTLSAVLIDDEGNFNFEIVEYGD